MSTPVPGEPPEQANPCAIARVAASRGDWEEAYQAFGRLDVDATCSADDLALLSTAGCLIGRVDAAIDAMSQAHDAYVGRGDVAAAVRCGFWVVFMLLGRGEPAQAGGCSRGASMRPTAWGPTMVPGAI